MVINNPTLLREPGEPLTLDVLRRWSNINPETGCWEWGRFVAKHGYGVVKIGGSGKQTLVHRAAYELAYGPIPEGMCVCHHCDNPPCCNPEHLFVGTNADNVRDSVRKGRRAPQQGDLNHNRTLTLDHVRAIRSLLGRGVPQKKIASLFGVVPQSISNINKGLTWKHAV